MAREMMSMRAFFNIDIKLHVFVKLPSCLEALKYGPLRFQLSKPGPTTKPSNSSRVEVHGWVRRVD
ncbi:hypothetical protein AC578_4763 [Pseudocercospora eumusae]|uniref:Uncharacterized protein n=1 Tax=Pseudocercospora eumusae TaxID=321146 RepID=A0A139HL64_9PEZI|nr:hypothetical protein AC578_4763 [Pseudocercospora eumusae]